jgi:glycosyltransferase involved in cell wall biosynthesis
MRTPISVILCTHNPRSDYLFRALQSLRAQTISLSRWEFLLVDNASKEPLTGTWDISWHPRGRHIREEELGLTAARVRGIKESVGQLLIFIDDDNILDPDFLDRAERIPARYPFLGVFGAGRLEPEYEVPPPQELLSRIGLLALRSTHSVTWSNDVEDTRCIPWGAGLCVTREIARQYPHLIESLNCNGVVGRRGQRLFSGEDDLFSWAAVSTGKGFGLFPELRITHLIQAVRLNRRYFVRLIHDHTFSHTVLRYLSAGIAPRRIEWSHYIRWVDWSHCLRLVFQGIRNGQLLHGIKKSQFSLQCQWAALRAEGSVARFIDENRLQSLQQSAVEAAGSSAAGPFAVDRPRHPTDQIMIFNKNHS